MDTVLAKHAAIGKHGGGLSCVAPAANLRDMHLPLWVYLFVSAAAIAAIAVMVRKLKPGAVPAMTAQEALRHFRDDCPSADSATSELTPDGRTFLILAPSGAVAGCVTVIGLRWTSRRIGARDVAGASADGTRTIVTFNDFTWPSLWIDWRDPIVARDWRDRFDAIRRADHA